jgi:hypothetical protein
MTYVSHFGVGVGLHALDRCTQLVLSLAGRALQLRITT